MVLSGCNSLQPDVQPTMLPTATVLFTKEPDMKPEFRVVGYATDWDAVPSEDVLAKLTHVNYAFLLPNADGSLGGVNNLWKLQSIVDMAHRHDVRVLISIGGWGYDDQFSAIAGDPEACKRFVQEAIAFVEANQLDGVDVDWEYPGPDEESAQNFVGLMSLLNTELRQRGKLLTAAVGPASHVHPEVFAWVDFLNLMAYDGDGQNHSSYEYAVEMLDDWHRRGLPREKMVLGVPFYAKPEGVPYRNLVAADPGAAQSDQSVYLDQTVYYNGIPTIQQKTRLAMSEAAGVMIWALAHDAEGAYSLLTAIDQVIYAQKTYSADSLGTGVRYSVYGPAYDPGPAYWNTVAWQMVEKFPDSHPEVIWIISTVTGAGTVFSFPGVSDYANIGFSAKDINEEALALFDESGVRVWLQLEPGNAPVEQLIHIALKRYGQHPCVVGVGVDVEWYQSYEEAMGVPVSDDAAAVWLAAARSYNPNYRLFLKHWLLKMMPPTLREGILFVDDSQQFDLLAQMTAEFKIWNDTFAPAPVAFQFGYPDDQKWWQQYDDPARTIGEAILQVAPNTRGLFWVDFTVFQLFPPNLR